MRRIKAAVLHDSHSALVVESVELTELQPDDVLVKVRASGLCHTDLEVMRGDLQYPLPIVLGHEGAGIVEDVGARVKHIQVGDHVICSWNPSCGQCYFCLRDQPTTCEVFLRTEARGHLMDDGSRLRLDGLELHHYSAVSSHAEYCVVSSLGVVPVSKEIPFDRACLIGCGVATGVSAVTRVVRVEPETTVLVVGCGAVGLNVIQGARMAGAGTIVAVDTNPQKLEYAQVFGATHIVDASTENPIDFVRSLTEGRGADYGFEAAGREASIRQTLEATRYGGAVVILGKTRMDDDVRIRFGSLVGDKTVVRSTYGGTRPHEDFPILVSAYLQGELMLDELVTTRLRLEDVNEGYARMEEPNCIRNVIVFDT